MPTPVDIIITTTTTTTTTIIIVIVVIIIIIIMKAPKTDHITSHLRTLHWFQISARINYKITSLCCDVIIDSTGPVYFFSDLLKIYTPSG